jgi:hypothetical protein
VGDVSYIVPEISLLATTPFESPHSWLVVAPRNEYWTQECFCPKSLGTMVIYLKNEQLRKDIKAEFLKRKERSLESHAA